MFYTMTRYGRYWNHTETKRNWQNASSRTQWKLSEHTGNYCIVQSPGLVNPDSYPCRRIRASDLWCRRQSDVTHIPRNYTKTDLGHHITLKVHRHFSLKQIPHFQQSLVLPGHPCHVGQYLMLCHAARHRSECTRDWAIASNQPIKSVLYLVGITLY